ncbi:uncharacterized protein YALI1_B19326g [Yarrowia lipolytica]|uniref:Uncharacterized protein n=1 Tax=Yarrowia lipolytica TaxID=4952 RepID=A0A1D8N7U2_YARLL|nr:hypothetical protein YALI1_B19326g [Yarrowia lipolytica]
MCTCHTQNTSIGLFHGICWVRGGLILVIAATNTKELDDHLAIFTQQQCNKRMNPQNRTLSSLTNRFLSASFSPIQHRVTLRPPHTLFYCSLNAFQAETTGEVNSRGPR